jgi:hypothetical protein
VRLHFPYHRGNPGSLTITVGAESSDWLMWEVPSDEGVAYRLEKVGLPAQGPFTVTIDPLSDRRECSCLRFLRRRDCDHLAALWALYQGGELK